MYHLSSYFRDGSYITETDITTVISQFIQDREMQLNRNNTQDVRMRCDNTQYIIIWVLLSKKFYIHIMSYHWHLYRYKLLNTGLFEMIVGVLTTCHTQYTWDRSIYIFLFNRTTLPVFVTYLTGTLYVHPLWFYKH